MWHIDESYAICSKCAGQFTCAHGYDASWNLAGGWLKTKTDAETACVSYSPIVSLVVHGSFYLAAMNQTTPSPLTTRRSEQKKQQHNAHQFLRCGCGCGCWWSVERWLGVCSASWRAADAAISAVVPSQQIGNHPLSKCSAFLGESHYFLLSANSTQYSRAIIIPSA